MHSWKWCNEKRILEIQTSIDLQSYKGFTSCFLVLLFLEAIASLQTRYVRIAYWLTDWLIHLNLFFYIRNINNFSVLCNFELNYNLVPKHSPKLKTVLLSPLISDIGNLPSSVQFQFNFKLKEIYVKQYNYISCNMTNSDS